MAEPLKVVFVTVPDAGSAEKIASGLVAAKLAACVTVLPGAVSFYAWEGQLHRDAEFQLLIKTRGRLLPELTRFVREHHPAKLPEIVAVPIEDGDRQYLDWVAAATNPARPVG
jgi:periplasmic divalent cation tolerance protein